MILKISVGCVGRFGRRIEKGEKLQLKYNLKNKHFIKRAGRIKGPSAKCLANSSSQCKSDYRLRWGRMREWVSIYVAMRKPSSFPCADLSIWLL